MRQRTLYFDTIRFLACFWVFTTHFIARFDSGLFRFWNTLPTSLLLKGMSGKLAVAVFAVLLGYFSARGGCREKSTLRYLADRYLYFFASGLVVNSLYGIAGHLNLLETAPSLWQVLRSSLTIDSDIFPAFWCMREFLFGSLLCFLNGKYRVGLFGAVAESAILFLLGSPWTGLCLLGCLLWRISEQGLDQALERPALAGLLFLVSFCLIKRPESTVTYLLDGVFALITLLILRRQRALQKLLDWHPLAGLLKNYMAIYLIHSLIYELFAPPIYALCRDLPHVLRFLTAYGGCFVLIVLASFPVTWLVDRLRAALCTLAGHIRLEQLESAVDRWGS